MAKKDLAIAGGKGANLAEMYNIGLPVPNAFVVTAQAYKHFLEKTKLNNTIMEILKNTDVNDTEQLQKNTKRIRELIEKTKMPEEIEREIEQAYAKLSKEYGVKEEWVVARSSATAEDIPSITDSDIIAKVNGKLFKGKISKLFSLPKDSILEVPAFQNGKIVWARAGIYKHYVKTKMYKITLRSGKNITITPDHSLITLSENMKPYVVSVSEISVGSLLPTPRFIEIESGKKELHIDHIFDENNISYSLIDDYIFVTNKKTQENNIPKTIKLTENFCYFLGLLLADGTIYKNEIILTSKNEKVRSKVLKALKEIGLEAKDKGADVKINSAPLSKLIKLLLFKEKKGSGKGSNIKYISHYLFEIDNDLKYAFLAGYFDGDGCIDKERFSFTTKFEILANDLVYFLSTLGYISIFKKRKIYWDVILPKKYTIKIFEKIKNNSVKLERKKIDQLKFDWIESYNFDLKDLFIDKFGKIKKIKLCPKCSSRIKKTSKYKGKNRYLCGFCHRTYFENVVLEKEHIDFYDRDS
ncbi:MAG: PEP/pyruvate-binding domain-containing protein, partial [Candidatus Ratteibacteria bacterium]